MSSYIMYFRVYVSNDKSYSQATLRTIMWSPTKNMSASATTENESFKQPVIYPVKGPPATAAIAADTT